MKRHAVLIGINEYPNFPPHKHLKGAVNDAHVMAELLKGRFGFMAENIELLLNSAASRDGILAAFERLVKRVGPGDVAVIFYAGHGSRVSSGDGFIEAMVASDSGRGDLPNRDVLDHEVDAVVQRINHVTPHVVLLFDCCHSGSVTRDPFGGATRELEPDLRGLPGAALATPKAVATRGLTADVMGMVAGAAGAVAGAAGAVAGAAVGAGIAAAPGATAHTFLSGVRDAVLVAACRATEQAAEHHERSEGTTLIHGALTWFLSRVLARIEGPVTWRDVFEAVVLQITARYPRQQPQLEGRVDTQVFGTAHLPAPPHLTVLSVDGNSQGPGGCEAEPGDTTQAVLSGGAAQGITVGSRWRLRSSVGDPASPSADATVTVVRALTATVQAVGSVQAGWRAEEVEHQLPSPKLTVGIQAPEADAARLRVALTSPLLAEAPKEQATVLARFAAGEWTVLDQDGRYAVRSRRGGDEAALAGDLARVARFRGLLTLENPFPDKELQEGVHLDVMRIVGKVSHLAEADLGLPFFVEGDLADFVVRNTLSYPVHVSLLQFGVDRAISLALPIAQHPTWQRGGLKVEAGQRVSMLDYYRRDPRYRGLTGLRLSLPQAFPWAAEPGEHPHDGRVTLRLMVTRGPTDFDFLVQPGTRAVLGPLEELAQLYGTGKGTRSFLPRPTQAKAPEGWAAVTRTLMVSKAGRKLAPGREG